MYTPTGIQGDIQRELRLIAESMRKPVPYLQLDELHAAPEKIRNGMLVLADGTDWDPGSGAGVYARVGGSWVKL